MKLVPLFALRLKPPDTEESKLFNCMNGDVGLATPCGKKKSLYQYYQGYCVVNSFFYCKTLYIDIVAI